MRNHPGDDGRGRAVPEIRRARRVRHDERVRQAADLLHHSELKNSRATVYLVLPPKYLDEHARFLRLFVNLALQEASKGQKQRYPILMVLDEFYALGRLQFVAKAAGLLSG
jgi:type IV secretory pathway TraG/TraD family ATPase VirD4